MFVEDERGSISKGKYADFLLVDKDVLTCPVTDIHTANPHLKFAIARQVPFGIEGFFLLPIPEFSGMGSNFFQSRVGEDSFAAGVLHIGEG